jgi:DNA-binding NtrC family response regulator
MMGIDIGATTIAGGWTRLNVFPIRLPALCERAEDIPALADYLLRLCRQRARRAPPSGSDLSRQSLLQMLRRRQP